MSSTTATPSTKPRQVGVLSDLEAPDFVTNRALLAWIQDIVDLTQPEFIHWCDGSQQEWYNITRKLINKGVLIPLDQELRPDSFLVRSDPDDVARVEEATPQRLEFTEACLTDVEHLGVAAVHHEERRAPHHPEVTLERGGHAVPVRVRWAWWWWAAPEPWWWAVPVQPSRRGRVPWW